jgi:hypothetical protein
MGKCGHCTRRGNILVIPWKQESTAIVSPFELESYLGGSLASGFGEGTSNGLLLGSF